MPEIKRYHHDDLTGEMHPHDHGTWVKMTDLDRQRLDFARLQSEREVEHAAVVANLTEQRDSATERNAQLLAKCEVMQRRIHDSASLVFDQYGEITELRARIRELEAALRNLMERLDDHFGGGPCASSDWKEQADARAALAADNGKETK